MTTFQGFNHSVIQAGQMDFNIDALDERVFLGGTPKLFVQLWQKNYILAKRTTYKKDYILEKNN